MADLTVSSDSTLAAQAYDLAQQNAADQVHKSGKNVVGTAQATAAAGTLGASAAAGSQAVDAVGGTAGQAQSKAVANSDAPSLPNPTGEVASPAKTLNAVKGSSVFASGGDGVFAALEAMSDSRQKDITNAMLIKRLQGQDQVTAKVQEFNDKAAEIHGNVVSADTKFAGSFLGLATTGGLTFYGSRIERGSTSSSASGDVEKAEAATKKSTSNATSAAADNSTSENAIQKANKHSEKAKQTVAENSKGSTDQNDVETAGVDKHSKDEEGEKTAAQQATVATDVKSADAAEKTGKNGLGRKRDDKQARGAMYRNIGMNAAGTVDAAVSMMDVNVGGTHDANQAQLAQKQDQVQAQIFQNNADSAGAWLDTAKDQRKSAQQAILSHVQMWSESVSNVWK